MGLELRDHGQVRFHYCNRADKARVFSSATPPTQLYGHRDANVIMPNVIVFLGPSLPASVARNTMAVEIRPPLRRGDLAEVAPGTIVGVVDGILYSDMLLTTAETCEAARRGVRLFGAASTGALLASRLRGEGMIGMGRVYERLLRTRSDAEAEDLIAVLYWDEGGRALTLPLIEPACWLEDRVAEGRIDQTLADEILRTLRDLPLEKRTRRFVNQILRKFLRTEAPGWDAPPLPGVKEADTLKLLRFLRDRFGLKPARRLQDSC